MPYTPEARAKRAKIAAIYGWFRNGLCCSLSLSKTRRHQPLNRSRRQAPRLLGSDVNACMGLRPVMPFWVKTGPDDPETGLPKHPGKQTFSRSVGLSQMCH
jgi:hypothetical protein